MKPHTQPYLTTLTPLRGIAALIVVFFHCNLMFRPFVPPGHTAFLDSAWLWVDFFFVLSGFIMCYVYGKYFKQSVSWPEFRKFIGARFARVYPLYFFTSVLAVIPCAIVVHYSVPMEPFIACIFNPKALPATLLLVQSMHTGFITAPLNTPTWSLSTEWWAYVVFPFCVPLFLSLKNRGRIVVTVLIAAAFVLLRYKVGPISYGNPGPTLNMLTDFGFLRCLAGFFTGMLLFSFYGNKNGYAFIKKDWFFVVCFLGLIVAMHFGIMDILIMIFFPLIIIAAAYNQGRVKRILDTRPLQRLGDWSFSIYLVHMPILLSLWARDTIRNPRIFLEMDPIFGPKANYMHGLYVCLVVVTLTLIISAFTYRYVEVPARNYFNKLFRTKQPRIRVEAVEV